ncbi:MAG: tRNA (guanosine(46)-N7)-methyltransferase TrmB [Acutalibacteraceae bacterium]
MRRLKKFDEREAFVRDIMIKCTVEDKRYNAAADGDEYIDLPALFGNDSPVYLEVGCGMGGFAAEFAKRHPQINLLAVEINENVIIKAAERTKAENIPNVRYLCVSANYLDRYIRDSAIERMFLNFSCPYPKNRYESHRLTSPVFLRIYRKILKNGAEIHQKTDNMHFFEYSIEQFSKHGFALQNLSLDLHHSDFEGNIVTEYESKFASQGLPIYRLEAVNQK